MSEESGLIKRILVTNSLKNRLKYYQQFNQQQLQVRIQSTPTACCILFSLQIIWPLQ